jgi:hypothetical protein
VADQVVGDLAEVVGGQHGVGELLERLVMQLLEDGDQAVNPVLTFVEVCS